MSKGPRCKSAGLVLFGHPGGGRVSNTQILTIRNSPTARRNIPEINSKCLKDLEVKESTDIKSADQRRNTTGVNTKNNSIYELCLFYTLYEE